ncbi:hypothetical protein EVAR_97414_1 [Eumeta japonica]|uniref:Uncharacterized protein n=1 Tax=Eumeta variegata TaxID=151549 RepID=A0A4C1WYK5_EUMVA|nr:hypothetical protein EVAR_97414_1 [Eumeta japonica]
MLHTHIPYRDCRTIILLLLNPRRSAGAGAAKDYRTTEPPPFFIMVIFNIYETNDFRSSFRYSSTYSRHTKSMSRDRRRERGRRHLVNYSLSRRALLSDYRRAGWDRWSRKTYTFDRVRKTIKGRRGSDAPRALISRQLPLAPAKRCALCRVITSQKIYLTTSFSRM